MSQFAVILPAAGSGTRFGGPVKKPFLTLAGRAVWLRTAELFWTRPDVSRVYVVVAPADLEEFKSRFGHTLLFANAEVVAGGAERFESVANAMARIPSDVPFVAVHDAVRPLTPPAVIDAVFAACKSAGAAIAAVPVADTLKKVDSNEFIEATVPRAGMWQAQTPQAGRRDWLIDAYARRSQLGSAITDDAQLLEAAGYRVQVVKSSATNFKLTTPDDFKLAELLLGGPSKPNEEKLAPRFGDEAEW
jgi:2-C-methyl-D-erythritol 4-phosphate cytidylyltransferase